MLTIQFNGSKFGREVIHCLWWDLVLVKQSVNPYENNRAGAHQCKKLAMEDGGLSEVKKYCPYKFGTARRRIMTGDIYSS